jgi:hypothetical protein
MFSTYRTTGDIISIGASVLCAVHCVLLPMLVSTLPLFGIEILENIWLEISTIMLSALAGGWAIWNGYKKFHRSSKWVWWFCMGFMSMLAGNFLQVEWQEMLMKSAGAIGIVIAHIGNLRYSKHHRCVNPLTK